MSVCTGVIVSMYLKGRIEDVLVCDDKQQWGLGWAWIIYGAGGDNTVWYDLFKSITKVIIYMHCVVCNALLGKVYLQMVSLIMY